jgi:type IX secretion system PorP/SprF family membrane protein
MNIKRVIYSSLLSLPLFCNPVLGQDIHFSQTEFAPLNLNPALAGALSPLQGIVNYRNQWRSISAPFQTISASVDGRFNVKNINRKGIMAGGLQFFNDKAGDNMVTNNASLNLAYHLRLDRNSTLGLGIYTGFGQRSIGMTGLKWGGQYVNGAYNPSLPGAGVSTSGFTYLDAGTGVVYTYKKNAGYMTQNDQFALNAGMAVYHVNRPGYSFTGVDSKLPMRYSAFINATIGIQNSRGSFLPGVYFHNQGKQNELYFGTYYKYLINEGSTVTGFVRPMAFYVGLYSRLKDAFVAKVMFDYDMYSLGVAYDINVSKLRAVSNLNGGVEFFLRYKLFEGRVSRATI